MTSRAIYRLALPVGLGGLLAACPCPDQTETTGLNATCQWVQGTTALDTTTTKPLLECEFQGQRVRSDTSGVGE